MANKTKRILHVTNKNALDMLSEHFGEGVRQLSEHEQKFGSGSYSMLYLWKGSDHEIELTFQKIPCPINNTCWLGVRL